MKLNITDTSKSNEHKMVLVAIDDSTNHEIIIEFQYTDTNKYKLLQFFIDTIKKCESDILKK